MLNVLWHSSFLLACDEEHHDAQLFQNEHWRVLYSARPLTNIFKQRRARMVLFVLGMFILLREPEGLLRFTWIEKILHGSVRPAQMLRFTSLALRNGQSPWDMPQELDFGLLRAGCQV